VVQLSVTAVGFPKINPCRSVRHLSRGLPMTVVEFGSALLAVKNS
jgi:hypothetical protein